MYFFRYCIVLIHLLFHIKIIMEWNSQQNETHQLFTLRKGIGNPTSTLWKAFKFPDDSLSVSFCRFFLNIFTPSLVVRSHVFVKSNSTLLPSELTATISILLELCNLHIVEVDSKRLSLNIFFRNILLTNVDFPALVSPGIDVDKRDNLNWYVFW